uniref:ATP synthase complex subunit 8 n=1 Tax=Homologenus malayensis TaxID=1505608 RepID=A0A0A7CD22_9EUCA|nr:ATP synthase F0 subunit 8 [Homologenus malayensis]AIB52331.1 ATP synthase F0 subunit 8 [Homologenus malayensis]
MPQMAPLMWLYLFFFFLTSLLVFMMLNYFLKPYKKNETLFIHEKLSEKTWKW